VTETTVVARHPASAIRGRSRRRGPNPSGGVVGVRDAVAIVVVAPRSFHVDVARRGCRVADKNLGIRPRMPSYVCFAGWSAQWPMPVVAVAISACLRAAFMVRARRARTHQGPDIFFDRGPYLVSSPRRPSCHPGRRADTLAAAILSALLFPRSARHRLGAVAVRRVLAHGRAAPASCATSVTRVAYLITAIFFIVHERSGGRSHCRSFHGVRATSTAVIGLALQETMGKHQGPGLAHPDRARTSRVGDWVKIDDRSRGRIGVRARHHTS